MYVAQFKEIDKKPQKHKTNPQENEAIAIDYMGPITHLSKFAQNKINGYLEINLGFEKVQTSSCIKWRF